MVAVGLVLLVLAFYWKLLTRQYTWMDHPDMPNQILPWYQAQAAAWHRGEFPLWDPHLWGGQPLIAQVVPSAAYPLNWLLYLMPLRDGHIQFFWIQMFFLGSHCLAALFAYALGRDLGYSRTASLLTGIAFSTVGFVGQVAWPQMLNGALWLPLSVLFFFRVLRSERPVASAALSGGFTGIAFLSGHHQIPIFLAFAMGGLWVYAIARQWRKWEVVRAAGIFGAFLFLTSALQTLPSLEFGRLALRWVGSANPVFWGQYVPYSVHHANSLLPARVLGLAFAPDREESFVGIVIVSLAFASLALGWRRPVVRVLSGLAAGSMLFSLGSMSVFHGVAYLFLPMVEKARSPHMAFYVAQFAIVLLAGFGLDALRDPDARGHVLLKRWTLGLVGAGLIAIAVLVILPMVRTQAGLEYERLAVLAMVALGLAALLHGWRSGAVTDRAAVALVTLLAVFEIGTVTGWNYTHRETPSGFLAVLERDREVADFLKQQPDLIRLDVDTEDVPYNFGDWYGIDQFRAYVAGMSENIAPFERERLNNGRTARRLFGLNYRLAAKPAFDEQEEVFSSQAGMKVYRDRTVMPRVWAVHEAVRSTPAELVAAASNGDMSRAVYLKTAAPALEACEGDDVRLMSRERERIVIEAAMRCRGMVILNDTYFPGWQATVDGKPAEIHEAYGAVRGVVADRGKHRIEMRYRPWSVYWGGALTALGLLGMAVMARKR